MFAFDGDKMSAQFTNSGDVNLSKVKSVLLESGMVVTGDALVPARAPQFVPPPDGLSPELQGFLLQKYPAGLFQHQAMSIDAVLQERDVCLATSTASGKSLAFMASAI